MIIFKKKKEGRGIEELENTSHPIDIAIEKTKQKQIANMSSRSVFRPTHRLFGPQGQRVGMMCSAFPDCLSAPNLGKAIEILKEDCKVAFTSDAVRHGEKYSQGNTFWYPSNQLPRCTFEQLASDLFQHHTRDIPSYDPSLSGVEWWVLYLHNIDDVGYHWDRDYGLELEKNQLVHPYLGTVTYLTSIGGPTVFLDMCGSTKPEKYDGYQFSRYRVSYPKPGKHVTFNGNLLHGAPSSLIPREESDSESGEDEEDGSDEESIPENEARITFLANVWIDHQPSQAEPLPEELLSSLSNESSIRMVFDQVEPIPLDITHGCRSSWALSANDETYRIEVPLPNEKTLEELNASPGRTYEVIFPRGDGVLLLEETAEGSSDSGEESEHLGEEEQQEVQRDRRNGKRKVGCVDQNSLKRSK